MSFMPLYLDLSAKSVLLAGCAPAALELTESLLKGGALVSCWCREPERQYSELLKSYPEQISFIRGSLDPAMAAGLLDRQNPPFLLVAAEEDEALNRALLDLCRERGVLCASAGGEEASVRFPQRVRRGLLELAIDAVAADELSWAVMKKLEKDFSRNWEDGSAAFAELRNSPPVRSLNAELREEKMRELAEAMFETNGRYEAAVSMLDRRARNG